MLSRPPQTPVLRWTAAGLAVVFFYANVLAGPLAQGTIWEERRKTIRRLQEAEQLLGRSPGSPAAVHQALASGQPSNEPGHQLLAQLPLPHRTLLPSQPVAPRQDLPPLVRTDLRPRTAQGAALPLGLASWLPAVTAAYGDVRAIAMVPRSSKLVILIQDAHELVEAQTNIAYLLHGISQHINSIREAMPGGHRAANDPSSSGSSPPPLVVGMEGAQGAFDLEPFRSLRHRAAAQEVADSLLQQAYLSGPEYFAVTNPQAPLLWGVEDPAHYVANVQAIKTTLPLEPQALALHAALSRYLAELKSGVYSAPLRTFDAKMEAYSAATLPLGEYVTWLASIRDLGPHAPNLQRFLQAFQEERTLNLSQVETDRTRLINQLVRTLDSHALATLVRSSVAFRTGQLTASLFYADLQRFCRQHDLDLAQFPAFHRYLRYVLLADQIDREALFHELTQVEHAHLDVLSTTPEQRQLLTLTRHLALLKKLFQHSLTPNEWKEYQKDRQAIHDLIPSLTALALRAQRPSTLPSEAVALPTLLPEFERFYTEATARNEALVRNLLAKMDELNAPASSLPRGEGRGAGNARPSSMDRQPLEPQIAVLVAGGFHTPGLQQLLQGQGISHVTLSPKLTKVDDATRYLDVFTRGRTPLEQLLLGEKLFVKPPLALAPQLVKVAVDRKMVFRFAIILLILSLVVWGLSLPEIQAELTRLFQEGKFLDPVSLSLAGAVHPRRGMDSTVDPLKVKVTIGQLPLLLLAWKQADRPPPPATDFLKEVPGTPPQLQKFGQPYKTRNQWVQIAIVPARRSWREWLQAQAADVTTWIKDRLSRLQQLPAIINLHHVWVQLKTAGQRPPSEDETLREFWRHLMEDGWLYHGTSTNNLDGIKQWGLDITHKPFALEEVDQFFALHQRFHGLPFPYKPDSHKESLSLTYDGELAQRHAEKPPEVIDILLRESQRMLKAYEAGEARGLTDQDYLWLQVLHKKYRTWAATHQPLVLAIPLNEALWASWISQVAREPALKDLHARYVAGTITAAELASQRTKLSFLDFEAFKILAKTLQSALGEQDLATFLRIQFPALLKDMLTEVLVQQIANTHLMVVRSDGTTEPLATFVPSSPGEFPTIGPKFQPEERQDLTPLHTTWAKIKTHIRTTVQRWSVLLGSFRRQVTDTLLSLEALAPTAEETKGTKEPEDHEGSRGLLVIPWSEITGGDILQGLIEWFRDLSPEFWVLSGVVALVLLTAWWVYHRFVVARNVAIASQASRDHPKRNEDTAFVKILPRTQAFPRGLIVAGVFDGMGGHEAGYRASRVAKRGVRKALEHPPSEASDAALIAWLGEALQAGVAAINQDKDLKNTQAGTTATVALLVPQPDGSARVFIANAGDSRAYVLLPDGEFQPLTVDNLDPSKQRVEKLVMKLPDLQRRLEDPADRFLRSVKTKKELTDANPVHRALFNHRQHVDNVLTVGQSYSPVVTVTSMPPGSVLILLSDGVHDNLTDEEIKDLVIQGSRGPVQTLAKTLVAQARARADQGKEQHPRAKDDDITALVIGWKLSEAPLVSPSDGRQQVAEPAKVGPLSVGQVFNLGVKNTSREGIVKFTYTGPVRLTLGRTTLILRRSSLGGDVLTLEDLATRLAIRMHPGNVYKVGGDPEDNDFPIEDRTVSWQHLQITYKITYEGTVVTVEDLQSTNGTTVQLAPSQEPSRASMGSPLEHDILAGLWEALAGLGVTEVLGSALVFISVGIVVAITLSMRAGLRILRDRASTRWVGPIITKRAMGEDPLSPEDAAQIDALIQAKKDQGRARSLEVYSKEAYEAAIAALMPRAPPAIWEALQSGQVEIHVIDLGPERGFRRPSAPTDRPIYERTFRDANGTIHIHLTQAFVEATRKTPHTLAQAIIHPLLEEVLHYTHLEAVLAEARYNAPTTLDGPLSDLSRFILEEAWRDRTTNGGLPYLVRLFLTPYTVSPATRQALLDRHQGAEEAVVAIEQAALKLSQAVRQAVFQLLTQQFQGISLLGPVLQALQAPRVTRPTRWMPPWQFGGRGALPFAEDTTFGLELELLITRQLGLTDGKSLPHAEWEQHRAEKIAAIRGVLPEAWEFESMGTHGNTCEIRTWKTSGVPYQNIAEDWAELMRGLEALQAVLPGGFYSVHMHVGRRSLTREVNGSKRLDIDTGRFARLVKVYEAMWRALAGYGYRAPQGRIHFLDHAVIRPDAKRRSVDHGAAMNLSASHPTIEVKIVTGLLDDQGKFDLDHLRDRAWWIFALLEAVTSKDDRMPLAALGLPTLAGHRPSDKLIRRFLEVVYEGDPVGKALALEIFDALQHEPAGNSEAARKIEQRAIKAIYGDLGLRKLYEFHAASEGYDAEYVAHLLDPTTLDALADDLVAVETSEDVAHWNQVHCGYFPVEMHAPLIEALTRARARRPAVWQPPLPFERPDWAQPAPIEVLRWRPPIPRPQRSSLGSSPETWRTAIQHLQSFHPRDVIPLQLQPARVAEIPPIAWTIEGYRAVARPLKRTAKRLFLPIFLLVFLAMTEQLNRGERWWEHPRAEPAVQQQVVVSPEQARQELVEAIRQLHPGGWRVIEILEGDTVTEIAQAVYEGRNPYKGEVPPYFLIVAANPRVLQKPGFIIPPGPLTIPPLALLDNPILRAQLIQVVVARWDRLGIPPGAFGPIPPRFLTKRGLATPVQRRSDGRLRSGLQPKSLGNILSNARDTGGQAQVNLWVEVSALTAWAIPVATLIGIIMALGIGLLVLQRLRLSIRGMSLASVRSGDGPQVPSQEAFDKDGFVRWLNAVLLPVVQRAIDEKPPSPWEQLSPEETRRIVVQRVQVNLLLGEGQTLFPIPVDSDGTTIRRDSLDWELILRSLPYQDLQELSELGAVLTTWTAWTAQEPKKLRVPILDLQKVADLDALIPDLALADLAGELSGLLPRLVVYDYGQGPFQGQSPEVTLGLIQQQLLDRLLGLGRADLADHVGALRFVVVPTTVVMDQAGYLDADRLIDAIKAPKDSTAIAGAAEELQRLFGLDLNAVALPLLSRRTHLWRATRDAITILRFLGTLEIQYSNGVQQAIRIDLLVQESA